MDRKILSVLQRDADTSLEALGETVNLSRNACWRRIRALEADGVIRRRVALIDPGLAGCPLMVFIKVRTSEHAAGWLDTFKAAVRTIPEISGVYRISGNLDYLIRARVADMAGYDRLYQQLIAKVALSDVSASFVMEEIKETTEVPL